MWGHKYKIPSYDSLDYPVKSKANAEIDKGKLLKNHEYAFIYQRLYKVFEKHKWS